MKRTAVAAVAMALLIAASPCAAQQTATHRVVMTVGDIVVMRPFTFAATVVGLAVFVVGYPIIALTGNDTAWEDMVVQPARATFTRCIGCDLIEEEEHEE